MVLDITKGYVDFMYKGKIVRGWGDLCDRCFPIIASSIEWISPGEKCELNDEERKEFIEEVRRYCRQDKFFRRKFKLIFVDDNGKKVPR